MTDLPPGWEWAQLEDLAAAGERPITDGPFGSNLKSTHYSDSGARVIRLQNIGDGQFKDDIAYIDLDHFETLRAHEVQAGDLVVASLGDNPPRACLVPELGDPAIVKADCIRVRLSPHVEPRWVLYMLLAPATKSHSASLIKGVGRPRLGMAHIKSIPIPLPPLKEQQRIVATLEDHLSRLDAGERGVARTLRRLTLLAKRIVVESVPIPGPPDWKLVRVADAGRVDLGRQRHPDWHTGPNMRPYLRVANVFEDRIDLSDVMEMDFPPDIFKRFKLEFGDILLNEGQSPEFLGRPAMYRDDAGEVAFTNSIIRFRAHSNINPEWALLVFRRHMHAGRFIQEVRITTNIAHLSATRFKSVEFPIPSMSEQERIVGDVKEHLDEVARFQAAAKRALSRSRALRRSLLAEAFAGRLVEQDPGDEPASVLLERIRAGRAAQPSARRGRRSKRGKPVQGSLL